LQHAEILEDKKNDVEAAQVDSMLKKVDASPSQSEADDDEEVPSAKKKEEQSENEAEEEKDFNLADILNEDSDESDLDEQSRGS